METRIIFLHLLAIVSGFKIYWNVPTFQCTHNYKIDYVKLLSTYGIQVNDGGKFQGNQVTIFYETQLGLYPRILKSGKMENGGIPQRGNFEKHLEKASTDLQKVIPWKEFSGLGVIDWEAWRPTWEFNWEPLRIYQTESIKRAKELHPTANDSAVKEIAERQWEDSAKLYMLETLRLAKKLRPQAPWCYYLFPDCYNYVGKKPKDFQCSASIRKGNDKLSWLWKDSTALCPSIYVYESQLDRYSFEQRTWRDNEKLREALRVATRTSKIYPYVNYFDKELIPEQEVWRMLAQAAAVGGSGAVIWGSSAAVASEELCKSLKQYIIETLGPAAEKVAWRSDLCSKEICNNQGRCTFPDDDYANAWKLFTDDTVKFYAGNITCRCSENYSGRFCEKKN
uniref:Hyaluronidase n=1 Tax=Cupiennius salei TaxID=6928 RepID=A0A0S4JYH2_CUPSA|nr:hyaluronidase precursor [Cupiennius salei]